MKILAYGDVVGRSGRDALLATMPLVQKEHGIDFTIVNVDNAAGGWGVTGEIADSILKARVDCLTGGDHVWDQKGTRKYLEQEKRLLRPLNYPNTNPGIGSRLFEKNGKKILVIHALGQVFIKDNANCPFGAVEQELARYKLGATVDAIIVDFHAEATSEKNAMGVFCDGRVSAVFGSHTHVPTADARLLPNGTAYITDLGMCGDYNGTIIGWDAKIPMKIFLNKTKQETKMESSSGEGEARGAIFHIKSGGLAHKILTVRNSQTTQVI